MNDTFGVLDLGSNSFHLVISEYHDNLFRKKYKSCGVSKTEMCILF